MEEGTKELFFSPKMKVFLPGESHGQRSLMGYSPQGRKESDMTERLDFHFPEVYTVSLAYRFFSLPPQHSLGFFDISGVERI